VHLWSNAIFPISCVLDPARASMLCVCVCARMFVCVSMLLFPCTHPFLCHSLRFAYSHSFSPFSVLSPRAGFFSASPIAVLSRRWIDTLLSLRLSLSVQKEMHLRAPSTTELISRSHFVFPYAISSCSDAFPNQSNISIPKASSMSTVSQRINQFCHFFGSHHFPCSLAN